MAAKDELLSIVVVTSGAELDRFEYSSKYSSRHSLITDALKPGAADIWFKNEMMPCVI